MTRGERAFDQWLDKNNPDDLSIYEIWLGGYKARAKIAWEESDRVSSRTAPNSRYDWDEADWTMTDTEIARELGCTKKTVWEARKRLGKPKVDGRKRETTGFRSRKYDWESVDWSKTDAEIAKEMGAYGTTVKNARMALERSGK